VVERAGAQSTADTRTDRPALPDEQRAQLLHDARRRARKTSITEAVDLLLMPSAAPTGISRARAMRRNCSVWSASGQASWRRPRPNMILLRR